MKWTKILFITNITLNFSFDYKQRLTNKGKKMILSDYLAEKGSMFFRLRSYTPLLIIPIIYQERESFHYVLQNHAWDEVFEIVCFMVCLLGVVIRLMTVAHVPSGTSGRNTRRQKANSLNTTGVYSIVRNPLYIGNYLIFIGITMLLQCWEVLVINTFLFVIAYLPIILKEEQYLGRIFGIKYKEYADQTPCILPNIALWQPPNLPFSWRMMLRREHDTWFTLALSFIVILHYREYVIAKGPELEILWLTLGALSLVTWLSVKLLKHYSHLLDVR